MPHGTTEDTTIKLKCSTNDPGKFTSKDFFVPKSSMVIANHWHMNRSPDLWGSNSNEFLPERFLEYDDLYIDSMGEPSETRPTLTSPPYFMPFQV